MIVSDNNRPLICLFYWSDDETINLNFICNLKVLRLPLSSIYESLNGKVINIMADDVNHFHRTLEYLHHIWKGPCESLIFGYMIYNEIGVAGMVGFSVLLCFTPLQGFSYFANEEII